MRFWFLGFFSSSNLSLCFLVSFQMFSTSSSDFRSLHHGHRGNKGEGGGGFRGHGQGQGGSNGSHWDVGGGYSEPVDIISRVVDGLDHIVGVHVLITSSGHTEGVLCLRPGRVDVLIAEAELAKLVLGVELTGWRGNGRHQWGWDGGCQRLCCRERHGGSEGLWGESDGSDGCGDWLREVEGCWHYQGLGRHQGGRDGDSPGDVNIQVPVDQVGCGERVEGVEGCGDEGGLVDRDEDRWWGVNDWSCGDSVVAVINGLLRHRGYTGEDGPDKNQILHNDGYVPSRAETVSPM